MPDRTRKRTERGLRSRNISCSRVAKTRPHEKTRTTAVRMAVARFDGTPLIPIFARIAVAEAAIAQRNANIHHVMSFAPKSCGSLHIRNTPHRSDLPAASPPPLAGRGASPAEQLATCDVPEGRYQGRDRPDPEDAENRGTECLRSRDFIQGLCDEGNDPSGDDQQRNVSNARLEHSLYSVRSADQGQRIETAFEVLKVAGGQKVGTE